MGLYDACNHTSRPPLAIAPVLAGLVFAAGHPGPQLAIGFRARFRRIHEHAVLPAADFLERVAQHLQEICVSRLHDAIETELDDRLRPAYRGDLALMIRGTLLLPGDIRAAADDTGRPTFAI